MSQEHRGTIFVEDAEVLAHQRFPGEQYILRLQAPRCARHARAGSFVHLRCDDDIPMRRPLSILGADAGAGWIELLYKVLGPGLRALARRVAGDTLSVLGPIGNGFAPAAGRPRAVLLGGGVGIPPLLFLAEQRAAAGAGETVAFFGSELPFPFATAPSALPVPGSGAASHNLARLEALGIPGRLASAAGLPGCHRGFVTALARAWLATLPPAELARCAIYACGPEPMLRASQALAAEFALPSALCLEEFMACAVGGCAGCAVPVTTPAGPAMRRVCVDGPVFDGYSIYPAG